MSFINCASFLMKNDYFLSFSQSEEEEEWISERSPSLKINDLMTPCFFIFAMVPFLRVSWKFYHLLSFSPFFYVSHIIFDIQTSCQKGPSTVAQDLGVQFRVRYFFQPLPYLSKSGIFQSLYEKCTWNVPELYLNTNYVPDVPNF